MTGVLWLDALARHFLAVAGLALTVEIGVAWLHAALARSTDEG